MNRKDVEKAWELRQVENRRKTKRRKKRIELVAEGTHLT
jgi:hypothetical protein